MLRPVKHEWLTCTGRWLREGCSGTEVASKTAFPMTSHNVEAGDLRRRPKQRSACSTFKEDLGWCHRNGWLCPPHYRCSPQSHRYQESTPAQRAIAQRFRPLDHGRLLPEAEFRSKMTCCGSFATCFLPFALVSSPRLAARSPDCSFRLDLCLLAPPWKCKVRVRQFMLSPKMLRSPKYLGR